MRADRGDAVDQLAPTQLHQLGYAGGDHRQVLAALRRMARERAAVEQERECARLIQDHAANPFALDRVPLLRTLLIIAPDETGLLVITLHHLVFDGWSKGVLANEIDASYNACRQGKPSPMPSLPIQYGDFTMWQRRWVEGEECAAQLLRWKERMSGAPILRLPADRIAGAGEKRRASGEGPSFIWRSGVMSSSTQNERPCVATIRSSSWIHRSRIEVCGRFSCSDCH